MQLSSSIASLLGLISRVGEIIIKSVYVMCILFECIYCIYTFSKRRELRSMSTYFHCYSNTNFIFYFILFIEGYFSNPEATTSTLDSKGCLRIGDLCYFDEDGFIFVVDRLKELIKYKGYQVHSYECFLIFSFSPPFLFFSFQSLF